LLERSLALASRKIVLHFPPRVVNRPIISTLVKRYDLEVNILKASISPREEGLLVVELSGTDEALNEGLGNLASMGVTIQPLSQDIVRNEERCTHCGACVTVCPTGALAMMPGSMKVAFDSNKCVACEACIPACPVRAMEAHF
jgi:ferredoxin